MKNLKTIRFIIFLLFSFIGSIQLSAQCFLTCNDFINYGVPANQSLTIFPNQILEGQPNCGSNFGIKIDTITAFPSSGSFSLDSLVLAQNTYGLFVITIAAFDSQGNIIASCWGTASIENPTGPCTLSCNPNTTFTFAANESIDISAIELLANSTSINCPPNSELVISLDTQIPPPSNIPASSFSSVASLPAGTFGTFSGTIGFLDGQGNLTTSCWGQVTIQEDFNNCNSDVVPPTVVCDQFTNVSVIAGENIEFQAKWLDDGSFDNCADTLNYFITTDGSLTAPPNTETLLISSGFNGIIPVYLWVVDEAGNANFCAAELFIETTQLVSGSIYAVSYTHLTLPTICSV